MDESLVDRIQENYYNVLQRIRIAAEYVNRDPQFIKLLVVTKGQSFESLEAAIRGNLRIFGENYVQEGIAKIQQFGRYNDIEWHMIGHVQSRKAQDVCQFFSYIHSLDSVKLAFRLDRFAGEMERKIPVLLECNVSGEENKFGFSVWSESIWDSLINEISQILALPNLDVRGLMTMPPYLPDPEEVRPFFRRLVRFRDFLAQHFPANVWAELSMGMSGDYEIAVQEGSTIVRVGTAIMGPRQK